MPIFLFWNGILWTFARWCPAEKRSFSKEGFFAEGPSKGDNVLFFSPLSVYPFSEYYELRYEAPKRSREY